MSPRRSLRTIAVATFLAAGIAAGQDAPPTKDPEPPPGAEPAPPIAPAFQPPAILVQRRKGLKEPTANAAVAAGLDWLRRHQAKDGHWDCDGFESGCEGAKCTESGLPGFDPGVTGLAVLTFLGAGTTHGEGPDAPLLAGALQYFAGVQDSTGCFGRRTNPHMLYTHSVATMAVTEALWLTRDEKLIAPATKARDFLLNSQNPYLAWRYGVRDGDNDTSATAYAVVALRTCEFASLGPMSYHCSGALAWFDKVTDPATGRVGYQQRGGLDARAWENPKTVERLREPEPPARPRKPGEKALIDPIPMIVEGLTAARRSTADPSGAPQRVLDRYPDAAHSALTAAAGASMTLVGGEESAALVERWATVVSLSPPFARVDGFLDLHSMLFGSLFHAQRPLTAKPKTASERKAWRPWRDAVVADLTEFQREVIDGCAAGSWDASRDPFGCAGGRVYSTAMAILALQAPNRFPKVWNPRVKKLK